ncbi:MAG: protein phosphatase 2C domain-containing protein [candidate division KSB1 bacterium]|nr:protein phosphatase 2C domain-containing protein [candidate division KSB1 bacterium]MDZ7300454.1 protein phosphatase 2C domain-containing protein [candidate division KSB1 bacterium]MDZ7308632.1 protein phosphatase 2C domain-containing protein [candidate division KSB1 bacterium]MDZ7351444.1 protein phosphatase 2C domain-containing protein [candidate division KSB1 bacterium]MDZ7355803.1 protein phosphatase 2C domain-containing protein [candidate division KSB1 bacterium]
MNALHVYGTSATGKVRTVNEDRFLLAGIHENLGGVTLHLPAGAELVRHPGLLVAVADGMGGHAAGELASRIVLQTLAEQVPYFLKAEMSTEEVVHQLDQLILHADNVLRQQALLVPEHADMGCTLVGILLREEACFSFHAGDSRLYRYHQRYLQQLTQDHSAAGMMERHGVMVNSSSREIFNSLGGGPGRACAPEIKSGISFTSGDILLLCSDGLSELVPVEAMEQALQAQATLPERGELLLKLANDNGGSDNITVVLIEAL